MITTILATLLSAYAQVCSCPCKGEINYTCDFKTSWQACGFSEQAKALPRASIVNIDTKTAARLLTKPGDNNVAGSGTAERDDLTMNQASTGASEGKEQWWSHQVYFPVDYIAPPVSTTWHWGVVMNFHNTNPGAGQANVQLVVLPGGVLSFWIMGGTLPQAKKDFATIVKNKWYNFTYQIKWSSNTDGYFKAWVDGKMVWEYKGPNMYPNQGVYLKLANYHTAIGKNVALVHTNIKRGTGPIVSPIALEGM